MICAQKTPVAICIEADELVCGYVASKGQCKLGLCTTKTCITSPGECEDHDTLHAACTARLKELIKRRQIGEGVLN